MSEPVPNPNKCGGCREFPENCACRPAHHPTLYSTGRYGSWGVCFCGWESPVLTNVTSVHLAFGAHLIEAEATR